LVLHGLLQSTNPAVIKTFALRFKINHPAWATTATRPSFSTYWITILRGNNTAAFCFGCTRATGKTQIIASDAKLDHQPLDIRNRACHFFLANIFSLTLELFDLGKNFLIRRHVYSPIMIKPEILERSDDNEFDPPNAMIY